MRSTIRPLIICGGSGTRLWPMSRETLPKQFICFRGKFSTFQETMLRVSNYSIYRDPVIVAAEPHRFLIERQLAEIEMAATVILEPERRDSGPAILAGCTMIAAEDPDMAVVILAADHVIEDPNAFNASVLAGLPAALSGHIVTFGIEPAHAATQYGYIELGQAIDSQTHHIQRFVEKPDAAAAERYVEKQYLWNSGNFLTLPETLKAEYRRSRPECCKAVAAAVSQATRLSGALRLNAADFTKAEKISIDYAVMELTTVAAVVPTACGWSDIGTWSALWELSERDESGNVWSGKTENINSQNCYVRTSGPLTSVIGVKDLIVIVESDAILVADRNQCGDVKKLTESLRLRGVAQADSHARVHRPWGWYEVMDSGEYFQVKRLAVYPNGRLSLQKHRFRAEHWVVVSGIAQVTVDDSVRILSANEHAEIPLGAVHRLENPGNMLLQIIEVQHGSYLGEDDIIRIEDIYERILVAAE